MLLNVVWNDILIVIKCIVCNNIVNSIQNNTVYPYIAWFWYASNKVLKCTPLIARMHIGSDVSICLIVHTVSQKRPPFIFWITGVRINQL